MKAVVAAFNQEKALVGAFSVITNLRICFGWNYFKALDDGGGAVHAVHVSHRYGASDGDKFHSALSFFKTLEKQS